MTTVELAYEDRGAGSPLVLLHAFPTDRSLWAAVADEVASDTWRVITPDLRGFGESALGDDAPSIDVVADDVIALLDRLGIDDAVIGGVSLGGYVTLNLLRRYPSRVRAAVLVDTKAAADDDGARQRREAMAVAVLEAGNNDAYADGWYGTLIGPTTRSWRPEAAARVREWAAVTPVQTVAWYQRAMAGRRDSLDLLPSVQVPSLIAVGTEDEITPLADAETMRLALAHSRLAVVAASGHLSPLEAPADLARPLISFLTTLTTAQ
jgi:pimeloyl-ACP methyl ester carboxylesterase